ncbi:hypothetical protein K438DRAFT_1761372 [Mycena galopus ATCC 62051]|nr:hypothetical protein K438DRAFT_1761372 [Mycena galopus ATCC 62051]
MAKGGRGGGVTGGVNRLEKNQAKLDCPEQMQVKSMLTPRISTLYVVAEAEASKSLEGLEWKPYYQRNMGNGVGCSGGGVSTCSRKEAEQEGPCSKKGGRRRLRKTHRNVPNSKRHSDPSGKILEINGGLEGGRIGKLKMVGIHRKMPIVAAGSRGDVPEKGGRK